MTYALVFLLGALYKASCVGFVHYSERGRPLATSLCSMLSASAEVGGILLSVWDVKRAPVFIAGYGVGTYLAVHFKSRRRSK